MKIKKSLNTEQQEFERKRSITTNSKVYNYKKSYKTRNIDGVIQTKDIDRILMSNTFYSVNLKREIFQ